MSGILSRALLISLSLMAPSFSYATGMIPESPIVIVDQGDGEGVINVRNSDSEPMLLLTTLQDIPGSADIQLIITPPVARVEPGQSQSVRFILASTEKLKTEQLRRVVFEGVPPQTKNNSEVRVTVRQNLPVIIRPAELAKDLSPWKNLSWKLVGGALQVSNNSPYVVRLSEAVQTMPDNTGWILPQPFVLPGQELTATLKDSKGSGTTKLVRIAPATTWGFAVDSYDAPLAN